MSELSVGTLSGLAANGYVIDVASGSLINQPGSILQVVRSSSSTNTATSSTSYVDAPESITITPKKADSTILVFLQVAYDIYWTTATEQSASVQITDSSDVPLTGAEGTQVGLLQIARANTVQARIRGDITLIGSHSPGSTASITYKARLKSTDGTAVIRFLSAVNSGQMIAMEVAA